MKLYIVACVSIVLLVVGGVAQATVLTNGDPVGPLSGALDSVVYYQITVPAGQNRLIVGISPAWWGGDTGDCDIWVKRGSQPTSYADADYYAARVGNFDKVTVPNPQAGTWYIALYGWSAYTGVNLVATYFVGQEGPPDMLINGVPRTGLCDDDGSELRFRFFVPNGQTKMEIKIYGGVGDADLYVKWWAPPTLSDWDYRPYIWGNNETVTVDNPKAGMWHIMVHGFSPYCGVSLKATCNGPNPDLVDMTNSKRSFTPTVASPGDTVHVETWIGNSSAFDAGAFGLSFYLSNDVNITPEDYSLGQLRRTEGLKASEIWQVAFDGQVSSKVPAGSYYVGWIIDSGNEISEAREDNNTAYKLGSLLTVTAPAHDLRGDYSPDSNLGFAPQTLTAGLAGQNLNVTLGFRSATALNSGQLQANIYLSTDTTITSSDILLTTATRTASVPANTWQLWTVSAPFPTTVLEGTYYVGWILDPGNTIPETNENNNTGHKQGYRLTVQPAVAPEPDLFDAGAAYRSFTPTPIERNQNLTVYWRVRNGGNANASSFKVNVYLSTDTTITAADRLLGSQTMNPLAQGNTAVGQLTAAIPASVPLGMYYVGWIIDVDGAVSESDENNNTAYVESGRLTVVEPPVVCDLSVSGTPTFTPPVLIWGEANQILTTTCTVANTGQGNSGPFKVSLYASVDATITNADYLLGVLNADGVPAQSSVLYPQACVLNPNIPPGAYYVGWIVDSANEVPETNENNNTKAVAGLVITTIGNVKGEYFNNRNLSGTPVLTRMDRAIDFNWGAGGPGTPVPVDNFSVRWTADLEITTADTYTFTTRTNDGVRLWVNDQLLIDRWTDLATVSVSSDPLVLPRGTYSLKMEYYERTGDAVAQLFWETPTLAQQIVPQDALQPPGRARAIYPRDGDIDVPQDVLLRWLPGGQAATHHIYFGSDEAAVSAATPATPGIYRGSVARETDTYAPGLLDWNRPYYWRIDEANEAELDSPWVGSVWSFTTANCLIVDNFENYTDKPGNLIYETWADGLVNSTGAVVGYLQPPYMERTIVHGGQQAMPLTYDNRNAPYYSQAERTWSAPQDWTVNGMDTLDLQVRGYPTPMAPVVESGGRMSVSGEGTDIWGKADQFTFVYKALRGDGSLIARVSSYGTGTDTWAKGGVMIRQGLDAGAVHALQVITGGAGNGASFQWRPVADDSSSRSDATTLVRAPYWVKIARQGNSLSGFVSANGSSWTQMGSTQVIPLSSPAYIGLCVTSHVAGVTRTFTFDNVQVSGAVGQWLTAEVGLTRNSPDDLYLTLEDDRGNSMMIFADDPGTVNATEWIDWRIPLSQFAGVDPTRITKLCIGVGHADARSGTGQGTVLVDDVRVIRSAGR